MDCGDQEGNTALHYAAANGHEQIVQALLARKCNVDAISNYGWTALMEASSYAHIAVVRLLLQHKANPNIVRGCVVSVW